MPFRGFDYVFVDQDAEQSQMPVHEAIVSYYQRHICYDNFGKIPPNANRLRIGNQQAMVVRTYNIPALRENPDTAMCAWNYGYLFN